MIGWLNARREAKRRDDDGWFQDMAEWIAAMRTLEREDRAADRRASGALRPHPPRTALADAHASTTVRALQVVPIESAPNPVRRPRPSAVA